MICTWFSECRMKKWWKYLAFLAWLAYLYVCGVVLFARGFLLTRQALPNNGSCDLSDCSPHRLTAETDPSPFNRRLYLDCLDIDQLRLMPVREFKHACKTNNQKIILLVIDALKYDFAVHNATLADEHRLPYQNRMPIFNQLLVSLPDNSRLFKFLANPPTTTLQRLKGLTTGSLPTFIDAGLNFGTSEISEDNILNQLVSQGRNIVTMGDDIWPSLFPNRTIREYPYPSFNMFDLDTVDNGVTKHLKRELYETDWSLLIAHFLGVDHCGHAHGPNHPEMARKLSQMNAVIKDVIDNMNDDTMLFVLGDHGMTASGDHGGDSQDEISAALFVYSPMPLMPSQIAPSELVVYQVDLVPTVAYIMGTAIPFSNLGKVMLDVLPEQIQGAEADSSVPYATEALVTNIEQIMLYINTYSRYTHLFSKEKIAAIAHKFHDLRDSLEHVRDVKSFVIFRTKSLRFLNFVRELFEEIWVQFDSFLMSRGLVLSFLLLTFTFLIIEGLPADKLEGVVDSWFLYGAFGVFVSSAALGLGSQYFQIVDDGLLLSLVSSLTLSIFLMAVTVVQHWKCISSLLLSFHQRTWSDMFPRLLLICSLLGFFSNSFVVEEGQVMQYLVITSTFTTIWTMKSANEPLPIGMKPRKEDKALLTKFWSQPRLRTFILAMVFAALVRLSVYFWRCREEQSWCMEGGIKGSRGSVALLATLALLGLFVTAVRMWLRACGNLVGFSPAVMLARYAPSVIVVCLGGYWVLEGRGRALASWQQQLLPWTVYGLVAAGVFVAILQPLCIYVVDRTDTFSVYGRDNIIPQLFRQVKEVISEKRKWESPVVYGLATAYSSVFIAVAQNLCLLFAMLLGERLASSTIIMFSCAAVLVTIHAYTRLEVSLVTVQLLHVPWGSVIGWGLLTSYFFYGTGHQPTFPTIHWHAAFIGTGSQFSNNIVPAFLVGLNTFCSQALMGFLLPVLLISPFTLHVMSPKWLGLVSNRDGRGLQQAISSEISQGEVLLYEKESSVQCAAFKLAAKYLLFNATRVIACMLAASFHCRHLMVWKVFAPRFIFEGLSFFVTLTALLLGYFILARISTKIDQTLIKLTKSS